ncbi:MAG: VOC family protein [Candidatus Babeliales bacterium]
MIKKIHMVILMQADLEAAVAFYQKLGLQLTFHLKDKWAEFELEGARLGLCPGNAKEERRAGIVFEIDNIAQFFQKMNNQVTFASDPIEKLHGIMVSIKDPNGNIIDLCQPTPKKLKKFIKEVKEKNSSD